MPRSRPASNPLSYHRHSGQYYVTRHGKRIYLGSIRSAALDEYYRLCRGEEKAVRAPAPAESAMPEATSMPPLPPTTTRATSITAKELANRFMAAQQANWKDPEVTRQGYHNWLARFLGDHPRLLAGDLTVEVFAAWKMSLRKREYRFDIAIICVRCILHSSYDCTQNQIVPDPEVPDMDYHKTAILNAVDIGIRCSGTNCQHSQCIQQEDLVAVYAECHVRLSASKTKWFTMEANRLNRYPAQF